VILIISGACIPENRHVYQKLQKPGNALNMEHNEDRTENGVTDSKWCNGSGKWPHKTLGICGSSHHGRRQEVNASHNIEIKLYIMLSVYNESHLYISYISIFS
jgi:hypothetical protein